MKELLTIRFSGRLRRKDYWLSVCGVQTLLFVVVISSIYAAMFILLGVAAFFTATDQHLVDLTFIDQHPVAIVPALIILALVVLPIIYVILLSFGYGARRLHDIGLSGWYQLLALIPGIGSPVLIVMYCLDSQRGANTWGENPKEVEFEITRLAAEQGYAAAQSRLALYYKTGMGVERNDAEAAKWYRKVAGH